MDSFKDHPIDVNKFRHHSTSSLRKDDRKGIDEFVTRYQENYDAVVIHRQSDKFICLHAVNFDQLTDDIKWRKKK
jgi:hypothetical protein